MAIQAQTTNEYFGPNLTDRVAFVTGGTRGIGAAICHALATRGASVAAGYSSDEVKARAMEEELIAAGTATSIHCGNVANPDDCRRTVAEVIDRHGRLDVLVNNAGITGDRSILKMSDEDWVKVLTVNLSGTFYMSKAALAHMVERGSGRIINISSVVGEMGNIGQANYAASKSGLFGLTKTLAREAAMMVARSEKVDSGGVGITVNTVSPGFIATEMVDTIPERILDGIKGRIPIGRLGQPEEVSRVVGFLCADESSYITGQIWSVNGGMDM